MEIRPYQASDHAGCMVLFESNLPDYFDASEGKMFDSWLSAQDEGHPARDNSAQDHYYVMEKAGALVACAGFYLHTDRQRCSFAWGMVRNDLLKQGLGTEMARFRIKAIETLYPEAAIRLETAQYTYRFYERMGFEVESFTPKYYGPNFDRYEMRRPGKKGL